MRSSQLWHHEWHPIKLSLVVDNFGVKYVGREHAEHLQAAFREHYDITSDWDGKKYIGFDLDWYLTKRGVHVSIEGYVDQERKDLGHKMPPKRQDSPYPNTPPNYVAKVQYTEYPNKSPLLGEWGKGLSRG